MKLKNKFDYPNLTSEAPLREGNKPEGRRYLGSPVAIVDDSQNIKYQQYQDPYGNMEMSIGEPSSNCEFSFTDKEKDDTDLFYFQARYYDSIAGRFMGRDPVTIETSMTSHFQLNPFQYVNNNPVLYVDQNGLEPSVAEGAAMAQDSYKPGSVDLLGGWSFNNLFSEGSLNIGTYSRQLSDGTSEYSLVNQGTNPTDLRDWGENAKQLFGGSVDVRKSMAYAEKFVGQHKSSEVTFIGHSKGGPESIANAMYTNRNAMVFNTARPNPGAYGLSTTSFTGDIRSFVVKGEILNNIFGTIPKAIGKTIYLPRQTSSMVNIMPMPIRTGFAIKDHCMPTVRKAVGERNVGGQ